MINSNYSIGLQRLKPLHTAYGAICMPIRKLLCTGTIAVQSALCLWWWSCTRLHTTSSRATDI